MTVAIAATGACSPAGAEPAVPPAPSARAARRPTEWTQLPSIAAAMGAAAATGGVTIDGVDAWGDPALGCYGVWLDLHGGTAAAPVLARQAVDGLAEADARLAIDDLVVPSTAEGVLAFRFLRKPYRGRVRAQLGVGRISAVACFGNQRSPAACEATCAGVLGAGRGSEAVPGGTP